jgi:tRNA pseudouridine38-40 synthase
MRFRLQVEYDGSAYSGWQVQDGQITIQGEIERALRTIFGRAIGITGAGRTDSGVHARGQIAHFDSSDDINTEKTIRSLNGILDKDIRITRLEAVNQDFHARYDAKIRVYHYYISQKPTALYRNYCWQVFWDLDLGLMNKTCKFILGRHNFKSFCREISEVKNHFCTVNKARWSIENDIIVFSIEANRFLHGMVRTLVGTMVDIGRAHRKVDDMNQILEAKDRSSAGPSAPAKGLVLEMIHY